MKIKTDIERLSGRVLIIVCAVLLFSGIATGGASAFVQPDVDRLLQTKSCPNCDLSEANLDNADLAGANMARANLFRTSLINANLDGANLTDASMQWAMPFNATLRDASLNRADLSNIGMTGADLTGANLTDTNLNNAQLAQSNFTSAILIRTDMTSANVSGANFTGANLTGAIFNGVWLDSTVNFTNATLIGVVSAIWNDANLDGAIVGDDWRGLDMSGRDLQYKDLSGMDMTGANFTNANMTGVNLTGAILTNANLTGAILTHVRLNNSNLAGANLSAQNFTGRDLSGANLSGANLSGVNLQNVFLVAADLSNANLSNASLTNAVLTNVNFYGVNLTNKNLSGVNLENAYLAKADLTGANLDQANLYGANLTDASLNADLTGADLRAILTRTKLTGATLNYTILIGADLSGQNLSGRSMYSAVLIGADLTDASLNNTNLSKANMSKTDLSGANLTDASLNYAVLSDASLNNANLTRAKMQNANMQNAKLQNASMLNAKLQFANLQNANLTGATPANLTDVSLNRAILVNATWTDGATCNMASIGRCNKNPPRPLSFSYTAPLSLTPSAAAYSTLTPTLTAPEMPAQGMTLQTRFFIIFEGDTLVTVTESSTLSSTIPEGILSYGKTYEYYVLDISTTDEVMDSAGPGVFTTPAKPAGVDDYGNSIAGRGFKDAQGQDIALADKKLNTLVTAGAGILAQQDILTAIQAAGGAVKDKDGRTLAAMNTNDVHVVRSQGGQGRELIMAASETNVVTTVKPLTASGYAMDASGNLKTAPDVAVNSSGISLPLGLFDFTISLDDFTNYTNVVIVPPTPLPPETKWYKVGAGGTLVEYPNFQVDASGNGILTLYDNDEYDKNPAWGVIRDPGGPSFAAAGSSISGGGGSGCFIATAAYGSYLHPFVKILRVFRDTMLLTSSRGRSIVSWYYRVSPPVADVIAKNGVLKAGVRLMLLPAIGLAFLCLKVGVVPVLVILACFMAIVLVSTRIVTSSGNKSKQDEFGGEQHA